MVYRSNYITHFISYAGQFPYGNVAPNAGAQASASAQAGGASAQAAAGANNFQNPRAG